MIASQFILEVRQNRSDLGCFGSLRSACERTAGLPIPPYIPHHGLVTVNDACSET